MVRDKHMDTGILRLSTLVYSEKEGIKKKETVLKRVVETVFVYNDNIPFSISEIHTNAINGINIEISEIEIFNIVENEKNKYFSKISESGEIKYKLSDDRFEKLCDVECKNIEECIDEFVTINELDKNSKEIIYKYIYGIFEKNIEDFSKIIGDEVEIEHSMSKDLSIEEARVIKQFIEWDNDEKNEAIVALMGFSLEYSMLVSKKQGLYGTRLGDIFSKKVMYIDTNIIYYCLGVNGTEYKWANENLLDKCREAGEKIKITSVTEKEFLNTLNHYINEINKYESASLSRLKYWNYIKNKDIYLFYLEWKSKRTKYNDANYFKKYIESLYREWIRRYKVEIDREVPYDETNDSDNSRIQEYISQIPYKGTVNYDAYNIYWIEKLRKREYANSFSEDRYFLLSPHKMLKKWDDMRNGERPIIIVPEIWMTMLNRFVCRSKDDYKSYINFINIKIPEEETIKNKQFYIIIKAIEEVTDIIEQQESIIDVIVEEKYDYLQSDIELSEEEIYEKTVEKAEKILSSKIVKLEEKVNKMQEVVNTSQQRENEVEKEKEEYKKSIINETQKRAAELYANNNLRNKKIIRLFLSITVTLLWGVILADFFVFKDKNNIIWKLIELVVNDTLISENIGDIFNGIVSFGSSIVVCKIDYTTIKILFNKDKQKKIKTYYIEKYISMFEKKDQ